MMKHIFSVFFVIFSFFGFAQKSHSFKEHQFPAKYLLKNSTDTVRAHIQNLGAFKLATYSPATIIKKLNMIDDSGKKYGVKEQDVAYIEFTDTKNVKHTFLAAPDALKVGLVEPLHAGKIKYFVDYYYVNIYGNIGATEYLVEEGKETIKSGLFNSSGKKLKERFAGHPDLIAMVDAMKTREDLIEILKIYDRK